MVAGRAHFRKAALYRITLVGAEIGALNAQRLDRGGHSALAVHVNLHPKRHTFKQRADLGDSV